MKSMTGYGKGVVNKDGRALTIELKAVNNRYLEINSRLPKVLSACDDVIRREIQKRIRRGSVDVFFSYENISKDSKCVIVDMPLAEEYVKAAKSLSEEFCLQNDFQAATLMRLPEVLKIDADREDPEILLSLVTQCVTLAIDSLDKMRQTEGDGIKKDLSSIILNIEKSLKDVATRVPKIVEEHRQKLESRIKEALGSIQIDEARLLSEVAFFADKSDINEEISRLTSHIEQFNLTLRDNQPLGRKLDFIAQEINREINTIGSKSNDIALTNMVVFMKTELEKIKEQIRNVE